MTGDDSFHELFHIAEKVDDMLNIDMDSIETRFFIVDNDGNETTDKDTIQEFLTRVQTIIQIIKGI